MDPTNLVEIAAQYRRLSDFDIAELHAQGPASFASPHVWQLLEQELLRRTSRAAPVQELEAELVTNRAPTTSSTHSQEALMIFPDLVADRARVCGWEIHEVVAENVVELVFKTDTGDESMHVCSFYEADGHPIMRFEGSATSAPADEEFLGRLSVALLERNAKLPLGHWAIQAHAGDRAFAFFVTQIAETVTATDFRAAVDAVLAERAFMKNL